jgi:hypothetical protein
MKFWDKDTVSDEDIANHEALKLAGYVFMCKLFPVEDDNRLMRLFRRMFVGGYECRISAETVKEETLSPQERKDRIEFLKKQLDNLVRNCDHALLNDGYCPTCKKHFGWGCDESPDKVCHYYSREEDGNSFVRLIDGRKYQLKATHDPNDESEDWCIFCGHPDERK